MRRPTYVFLPAVVLRRIWSFIMNAVLAMPKQSVKESLTVRDKFTAVRKELNESLIERSEEIDLLLTALIAGEHLLLVGPPGVGKSLLIDSLMLQELQKELRNISTLP